jgi:hypothetical protein
MSQAVQNFFISACVLEGACICFVLLAWLYACLYKKGHLGLVRIFLLVGLLLYSALRILYWYCRYTQVSEPPLGPWHVATDVVERIEWLLLLLILSVLLFFWATAVHEEYEWSVGAERCFNVGLIATAVGAIVFCVVASAW